MRPIIWDVNAIDGVLSEMKYSSVKEWRLEHWASHLAAQRMGTVQYFAKKYSLDYNPNMRRERETTTFKKRKSNS